MSAFAAPLRTEVRGVRRELRARRRVDRSAPPSKQAIITKRAKSDLFRAPPHVRSALRGPSNSSLGQRQKNSRLGKAHISHFGFPVGTVSISGESPSGLDSGNFDWSCKLGAGRRRGSTKARREIGMCSKELSRSAGARGAPGQSLLRILCAPGRVAFVPRLSMNSDLEHAARSPQSSGLLAFIFPANVVGTADVQP